MGMIQMSGICKRYRLSDGGSLPVLENLELSVERGEFAAIMGESGAGKSTLMNLIGTMDTPDAGTYFLDGTDIFSLSGKQLSAFRSQKIGFIFQSFSLIASLTALENVKLPLSYQHLPRSLQQQKAIQALAEVGLSERMHHLPGQLSGGQRQRTAIARAIAADPEVILADEPTGSLDAVSGKEVMEALAKLHQAGKTILLITHDAKAASYADRILYLHDGKLWETPAQIP